MTPSIMVERCNAVQFRLNVTYADCHLQALFAECHCAEHHYVESINAEHHYAECHYAESLNAVSFY
jgi:hypothetical protein